MGAYVIHLLQVQTTKITLNEREGKRKKLLALYASKACLYRWSHHQHNSNWIWKEEEPACVKESNDSFIHHKLERQRVSLSLTHFIFPSFIFDLSVHPIFFSFSLPMACSLWSKFYIIFSFMDASSTSAADKINVSPRTQTHWLWKRRRRRRRKRKKVTILLCQEWTLITEEEIV